MSKENKKPKITKNDVPENFTLGLVLVDAIPVIFFGVNCILIGTHLPNILFVIGAALCLWAGAAKVIWKLIVVLKKKNIWWMFMQMRIVMPIGFVLMIVSVVLARKSIDFYAVKDIVLGLPSAIFFGLGVLGMILMGVFAGVLDSKNVKANWIEQITNGLAHISIFIGLLLTGR